MSQFFVPTADKSWTAFGLDGASLDIRRLLSPQVSGSQASLLEAAYAARVLSFRVGDAERWVVVASHDAPLRVNGIPLGAAGARVLNDRDEISIPGMGSAYYSAEALAQVVAFPGSERPVFCGRCRQAIQPGSPAVRCPGCQIWYDQSQEFPCWQYSATCAFCSQPTALDTGFNWVPEEE